MNIMKPIPSLALAALALAACLQSAQAQLTIPSDGSDLAFNPTENTVIDLSEAVDGVWNADNTANKTKGIYDANKWAVVFKYSSVNIPAGVKVTFRNHRSRAPVVWLVRGDVIINGELNLDGGSGSTGVDALMPSEPGPGGFRGGPAGPQGAGTGLGPGGGGTDYNPDASAGKYSPLYGNPQIIPLLGGSGGGGNYGLGEAGKAGGGAILLAAGGNVTINGSIAARGGPAGWGHGSGGAVKIISNQVDGTGDISVLGYSSGRIRIETGTLAPTLHTYPETIKVSPSIPPVMWPSDSGPKVRIVSVDAFAAPPEPTAPLSSSADIAIQNDDEVIVTVESTNFPTEGTVQVRVAQKWGGGEWKTAEHPVGDQARATWTAKVKFVKGYTTLQARATAP